jgi:hypothetical protein
MLSKQSVDIRPQNLRICKGQSSLSQQAPPDHVEHCFARDAQDPSGFLVTDPFVRDLRH